MKEFNDSIGFGFIQEDGKKDEPVHRLVTQVEDCNLTKKEAGLASKLLKARKARRKIFRSHLIAE